jgi:hypothetical protein
MERVRAEARIANAEWAQAWTERQQQRAVESPQEAPPAEPDKEEAKERTSTFDVLVGKQPRPRRILKKLRSPKEGKEVTDDHDHHS